MRLAGIALGLVALLTLPVVIGDAHGFYGASRQAGWAGQRVYPFNALWPVAPTDDRVISVAGDMQVVTVRVIPTWLAHLIHPAIVLLAVPLTAAALFVRRRLSVGDLFALLALLFLLRCLLDPVDNAYYHVPFLLSLAFWEGLGRRRPPVFTVLASVAIWLRVLQGDDVGQHRVPQRRIPRRHGAVRGGTVDGRFRPARPVHAQLHERSARRAVRRLTRTPRIGRGR